MRRWWIARTERLCFWLAYLLPQRVVYWAVVRATEKATGKLRPKWLNRGVIWGPDFRVYVEHVLTKWERTQ